MLMRSTNSKRAYVILLLIGFSFIPGVFLHQQAFGATAGTLEVWWPTNGATVTGVQPFQTMLQNASIDSYQAYWQVDGGQMNLMETSYKSYPHKESSVDVSGWNWKGKGPYVITFTAKQNGSTVAQRSVSIYTEAATAVSAPAPVAVAAPAPSSNLYVNPSSDAATQAVAWKSSRPTDARMMETLAAQPTAIWLGNWNSDVERDVRVVMQKAGSASPVFVAYNIPLRDFSGGYSSGGVDSASQYANWISSIARGIGSGKAIVVLEPDALADMANLPQTEQDKRYSLLAAAVSTLKQNSGTKVYIDAGHAGWVESAQMAARLHKSGVAKADGFALNSSNYQSDAQIITYGTAISGLVGNKHFVIDTSRNGKGSGDGQWCNLGSAGIGKKPTLSTGNALVDAYLWIKVPGQSDGTCNGGPSAGQWWPDMALKLVQQGV